MNQFNIYVSENLQRVLLNIYFYLQIRMVYTTYSIKNGVLNGKEFLC